MNYDGQSIQLLKVEDGIYNLCFNSKYNRFNTFDKNTLKELEDVLIEIKNLDDIKGLLLTSAKDSFIVGADITEFSEHFNKSHEELYNWLIYQNNIFNEFEDLNIPTITAINGHAFGGGLEITLTTSYRIALSKAKLGLLETNLGIIPGWGGSVRVTKLCGPLVSAEWVTSGRQYSATKALEAKLVDLVVNENIQDAAISYLKRAISGELDWKKRRDKKINPLPISNKNYSMLEKLKIKLDNPNYPAPLKGLETILEGIKLSRDEAQKIECNNFAILSHTNTAKSLTNVFLSDQYIKRIASKMVSGDKLPEKVMVLGAGAMGAGIAYQTSYKGVPVFLKDISQEALDNGMKFINNLSEKSGSTLDVKTIQDYEVDNLDKVGIAIEAIVENEKIKLDTFKELEARLSDDAIIASNTSTISISKMGKSLQRPENFLGIHFFNPVHRMPLVEIIRGEKTSNKTISKAVEFILGLQKKPIVVNDCAGFLVNRIFFPYLHSFAKLLSEGVDHIRIDKVMHKFGWPMGPGYLSDVIGMDIAFHGADIMAEAYPDRMKYDFGNIYKLMVDNGRLGEKSGKGFYSYKKNEKGRFEKEIDSETYEILKKQIKSNREISGEEIWERMLLPMLVEACLCLEDNIVASPQELDMALIYGLGFPTFRGGLLRFADDLGIDKLMEYCDKYKDFGNEYHPTKFMLEMHKNKSKFYKD